MALPAPPAAPDRVRRHGPHARPARRGRTATATRRDGRDGRALTGTAARFSPLTLLLALFMVGYVMWLGNNLTALAPATAATARHHDHGHHRPPRHGRTGYLAPRCAACCKIAMGVTMGYMLVMML